MIDPTENPAATAIARAVYVRVRDTPEVIQAIGLITDSTVAQLRNDGNVVSDEDQAMIAYYIRMSIGSVGIYAGVNRVLRAVKDEDADGGGT